jgi:hypothetical protein
VKITLTPSGGTPFVLGDDTATPRAVIADGFRPRQTRQVQSQGLFRGPYKADLARYNLENSLTFVVERSFTTQEAAQNFMALHADTVPISGTLTIYLRSATGVSQRTLANAVMRDIECVEHTGVTCKFQYTVTGNGAWT